MDQFLQAIANHPWISFWLGVLLYALIDSICVTIYNIVAVKNQKK